MKDTNLFCFSIIEEIGPVWISLHETKLKEFHQANMKHFLTYVVSGFLVYFCAFVYWDASN